MTLDELKPGQYARIEKVEGMGATRHHFLDMGLTPGTKIRLIKVAPMGDPIEVRIRHYELTLRLEDAEKIQISAVQSNNEPDKYMNNSERQAERIHPRIGETDVPTAKRIESPIPKGQLLHFALVGNQNCGKTTLFNQLTGSRQRVGNFPGVTVDRKDAQIRGVKDAIVTDLPGIYSLSPYTSEEIVTREFLLNNRPEGIINILDATNMERNLYLTLQLMELDIPMVMAMNMMDEVKENKGTIRINELEEILGVPVVPISAIKNEGVDELIKHALHVARYREHPNPIDFCPSKGEEKETALHRCIHSTMHLIENHAERAKLPPRFIATKLVEGDELILKLLHLQEKEEELIKGVIKQMEEETGKDQKAALADMRFNFIDRVCDRVVVKGNESKEHLRSLALDRILTGKYTAFISFLAIIGGIFWLTFSVIGAFLADLLDQAINIFTNWSDQFLYNIQINPTLHSLIIEGIYAGVGSVLSFLPIIVTLFFFLSIIEDTGYMARVAFMMDKPLRKIGLSGRSFVPMLIGFGCSIPAIMATRTIPSDRDRKMTILLVPFMSCSAKLTIYALFTAVFFTSHQTLVILALYVIGIGVGILFALIIKCFGFKGQPVPFVMELPNYRFPSMKSILRLSWEKAKDFITKAFTIIFVASIIVWVLRSFDLRFNLVTEAQDSLLALLGSAIAPLFKPLGFNDWRVSTALITGFMAKESVVSTLSVLLEGTDTVLNTLFAPFTAFIFLVFTLFYTPCIAAIAAVKRELGGKWAVIISLSQCVIAWIMAYITYLIGQFIINLL